MDASKFEAMLRLCAMKPTRRDAPRLLMGWVAGIASAQLAIHGTAARKRGKRCRKRKGKNARKTCATKQPNQPNAIPANPPLPFCASQADDAPCAGGKCLRGVCNPTPICTGGELPCLTGEECCGGECSPENKLCGRGPAGHVCLDGKDCASGVCVGHRCADTGCIFNNDYCILGVGTCHGGGFCLQAADGSGPRCGVDTGASGICNCTTHEECVAALGAGAFCANDSGPHCSCSGAPTFCVGPR
jgi:hypothetical protein